MTAAIRVLIADDHEIVREGLRALLVEEPDIEIIGEATNGLEAVSLALSLAPDVILMDIVMPEMDGLQAARRIRENGGPSYIVMLTTFADASQVQEAIRSGATGYLLKDVLKTDLVGAIRSAAQARPALHPEAQRFLMRQIADPEPRSPIASLSKREHDVLRLIAHGQSNKEIGASLHLTEGTVKGYVSSVLVKLGVADRTQAALLAVKYGVD